MNTSGKTLLIRADASEVIGAGHVMRCLALAQTWRESGGRVIFACCSLPEVFEQRLRQEKMVVCRMDGSTGSPEDSRQTLDLAALEKPSAILVDHYQAKESYLASLKNSAWKVVCIDDNAELPSYPVDYILNLNGHARAAHYESKSSARLLLGPSYALLRREFLPYRDTKRSLKKKGRRLLLSFGGGNQVPAFARLFNCLADELKDFELSFVLARPEFDRTPLETALRFHNQTCNWLISPASMAEEMARHDLLISSGGSSVWEALFMEIPSIFIAIAENQQNSCLALKEMVRNPVFPSLDEVNGEVVASFLHDLIFQQSLAQSGRNIVDGYGAERVIETLILN